MLVLLVCISPCNSFVFLRLVYALSKLAPNYDLIMTEYVCLTSPAPSPVISKELCAAV